MYSSDDTIAAIASAPGGAARGIVRVSGPRVGEIIAAVFERAPKSRSEHEGLDDRPQAAGALRRNLPHAPFAGRRGAWRYGGHLQATTSFGHDLRLPADLYFWPGARSYTRQPLAEFHAFGSEPLLAAALRAVCAAGARAAEPGEFTLRAYLAGRIDLAQAEAVLGVIDAAGREDLDVALEQLAGGLAGPLGAARESLLDLLAHLEAGLDFVDEDIEFITHDQLLAQLSAALVQVERVEEQMAGRTLASDAPRVVLYGRPNVGKSSLFNALCGADAALVADAPGATRDYVTASLTVAGVRIELIDTAGVHESEGGLVAVEPVSPPTPHSPADEPMSPARRGSFDAPAVASQRATARQRSRGDLGVLCLDATCPCDAWERAALDRASHDVELVALTKVDLAASGEIAGEIAAIQGSTTATVIPTSALGGVGIERLRQAIGDRLAGLVRRESGAVLATAERTKHSLATARESLERARSIHAARAGEELIAAELRAALSALGEVTGVVAADDILDRVFSRFCIGK